MIKLKEILPTLPKRKGKRTLKKSLINTKIENYLSYPQKFHKIKRKELNNEKELC